MKEEEKITQYMKMISVLYIVVKNAEDMRINIGENWFIL